MELSNHQLIYISTVTPVYSGALFLNQLVVELEKTKLLLENENWPCRILECIFVDDGSIDGSEQVLMELETKYSWVRVVTLSRNFGQHPATIAGIMHSSGDWVVSLDEDLQHKPNEIINLIKSAITTNNDVVYALPQNSVHESFFRDWSSKYFKKFMSLITNNPHISKFNSFRLMRGNIARAAASVSNDSTYYDIALVWFTSRVGQITVSMKDDRFIKNSNSGYSLFKLISHAKRMVKSSELKILRLGGAIGLVSLFLSILFSVYIFYLKYTAPDEIVTQGWASTIILISFLGGIISLLLSISLEYLSSLVIHSHGKPKYFITDRRSDAILRCWFNNMGSE